MECTLALGNRFRIWGWGSTQAIANRVVVEKIVNNVRNCGVIKDMRSFHIGYKDLEKPSTAKKWLDTNLPCIPPKGHLGPS